MILNSEIVDNVIVMNLPGRFEIVKPSELEKEMISIINKDNDKHLLLNLKNVDFMNSSMIGIILSIKQTLQERKKSVKLCNLNNAARVVLEVLELEKMFEFFESEEEAITSFKGV
jgi:anti-anti-sigma factor